MLLAINEIKVKRDVTLINFLLSVWISVEGVV